MQLDEVRVMAARRTRCSSTANSARPPSGSGGFQVFDVANVGNKDFAQPIVTAPFANQRMSVGTKNATGLAVGSPAPLDLKRVQLPENEEQPIAPVYGYAFISDAAEGLVVVDIRTLSDGNPTNNGLRRSATFNPNGQLTGASSITLAGEKSGRGCRHRPR